MLKADYGAANRDNWCDNANTQIMTRQELTAKGKQLLALWQELPGRAANTLPGWQNVSATALLPIMDQAWVLDHHPPDKMIVRYMGSRVVTYAGQDTTGQDFLTKRIAPENRPYMLALYQLAFDARCGVCLTRLLRRSGRNSKIMTTTFFPLNGDRPDNWILLGLSEIETTSARADTAGKADFYSSHLEDPLFIDIGFGVPQDADVAERLTALKPT